MSNYFEALGLKEFPVPTQADVKSAFRRQAQQWHPDRDPKNAERFKLISAAYTGLQSQHDIEDYVWRLHAAILTKSQQSWVIAWAEVTGEQAPNFTTSRPRAANGRRGTTANESYDWSRRARAAWRTGAAWDEEEREARRAPSWDEEERKARRAARQTSRPKGQERCGHDTTSGPCVRPEGHTPNGHMSQAVADKKRANQKARQS